MSYFIKSKGKDLADEIFISKIEPIVKKYELKKIEYLKKIDELKKSVGLKLDEDLEKLYASRLEDNKEILELNVKNLDSIISGESSKSLSDNEIRQYSMFLKASCLYLIKDEWNVSKNFENSYLGYFYSFESVSKKLNKDSNPLSIKKDLKPNYNIEEIESFIKLLKSQLVNMNPEILSLNEKDEKSAQNFLKELSTICSPIGFYENIKAKVSECLITKNIEKSLSTKEYKSSPDQRINSGTILTLNHPVIKKLVIENYGVIVRENEEVEFNLNLSMHLKDLINDPNSKITHHQNYGIPGLGSFTSEETKFDSLFAKRKLKELEYVHSFIKVPGNIKFVYGY